VRVVVDVVDNEPRYKAQIAVRGDHPFAADKSTGAVLTHTFVFNSGWLNTGSSTPDSTGSDHIVPIQFTRYSTDTGLLETVSGLETLRRRGKRVPPPLVSPETKKPMTKKSKNIVRTRTHRRIHQLCLGKK
jgi:hypothetical protein